MINSVEAIQSFQNAMSNYGLASTEVIIPDGNLHRFYVNGDKPSSKNGWYVLYANGVAAGAFGCWKRHIQQKWCYKPFEELSQTEKNYYQYYLNEINQKKKQEIAILCEQAQKQAVFCWEKASDVTAHPYLTNKKIKSYGTRINSKGQLIVPVHDSSNTIFSLQFINENGAKFFLTNGAVKGHFFRVGEMTRKIYVCEGYATGATIHEATGQCVMVAFNAKNLVPVAKEIRKNLQNAEIIICADNDQWTDNNPGLCEAKEAATAINATYIIPMFNSYEGKPTDFNDLALMEGLGAVKEQLNNTEKHTLDLERDQSGNQATKIIELLKNVELFHDEQGEAYATFEHQSHFETWPLNSKSLQEWIAHQFWLAHGKALGKQTLQDALAVIHGKALFEGSCQTIFNRVGIKESSIYINLANKQWETVEVNSEGWKVLQQSPVKFKGSRFAKSLPLPEHGGSIEDLWQFINIPENSRKLVLAWIVECFRVNTHFPILVLTGVQGSAKSTTQAIIRELIDPSTSNLRCAPKKSEDLFVAAVNNWLVSLNNISHLSSSQQDDLCCLATGGGFASRQLYSNHQEILVDIKRPVIINGISDLITAQDLMDRCILIELPTIEEGSRKTEQEILEAFRKLHPRLLGALLTILSRLLHEVHHVHLTEKPRMADFAVLGLALEQVMGWEPGSFIQEYRDNCAQNIQSALEHSPVAASLIKFLETNNEYFGSYNKLFDLLSLNFKQNQYGWPRSAKGLAIELKRQAIALKMAGINLNFDTHRHNDGYHVGITLTNK